MNEIAKHFAKRISRQIYAAQEAERARESAAAAHADEEAREAAEPVVTYEDPVEKWKRDGELRKQQRANAKAELRRQERDIVRSQPRPQSVDWDAIDLRIATALAEERRELIGKIQDVAESTVAFSNAVDSKLRQIEKQLNKQPDVAKDIAALRAQCAALQTGAQAQLERTRDLKTDLDALRTEVSRVDQN